MSTENEAPKVVIGDLRREVEFWGEHGPELVVVSDSEPEHAPGRIWVAPQLFTTADVLNDPEYRRRFEESMRAWQEEREKTLAGQYERMNEAFAEFAKTFFEHSGLRALFDEIGAQIRDLFELMADAAHKMNEALADEEEPKP